MSYALLRSKTLGDIHEIAEDGATFCFTILSNSGISSARFVVDFEQVIHRAISIPEAEIRGCNFHLGQAWYRKLQQLGLSVLYQKAEEKIGKWLVYIFGLSFLNPSEASDCFVDDLITIKPQKAKIDSICDYLVKTYVAEISLYPPVVWSEASSALTRMTNECESFHYELNASFLGFSALLKL